MKIDQALQQVFLSYSSSNQDFVERLALRLRNEAYLSFWFGPWHSIPGVSKQEQIEEALLNSTSCAIFIGPDRLNDWQNEQMRTAIQRRVEDNNDFRVIPIFLPNSTIQKQDIAPFLRRYECIKFKSIKDEGAFQRLLSGILGIPPFEIDDYIQKRKEQLKLRQPPPSNFQNGHVLIIGISNYPHPEVNLLPETVLNDANNLNDILINKESCGYPDCQVDTLIDSEATGEAIRTKLNELIKRTSVDDTVIIFFSGHGFCSNGNEIQHYLAPYDINPADLLRTAISGDEMTLFFKRIKAGRILVILDCCHSAGIGDPKRLSSQTNYGLSEDYYQLLAQGKGRVVIASSRSDEVSWILPGMNNSLFTHYLIEALSGKAKTLGDGYIRVFDIFRHIAEFVPMKANQHPIFKAADLDTDFAIALVQ